MRAAYAQDAILLMDRAADHRVPGAAVTQALCGHWDHEGPCPVAPHHTRADRSGDRVVVRILFAVEPHREDDVRARIVSVLSREEAQGPGGASTRWQLLTTEAGDIRPEEKEHADRLRDSELG